jgi:hypothetical protein
MGAYCSYREMNHDLSFSQVVGYCQMVPAGFAHGLTITIHSS